MRQPLPFVRSQSYKAQVRVLYIASFASRANKLPWPNRLQSAITTAFLATRNISFTTTSGRCTWCRIENSQTTSKLASAKGSARPVPRISARKCEHDCDVRCREAHQPVRCRKGKRSGARNANREAGIPLRFPHPEQI